MSLIVRAGYFDKNFGVGFILENAPIVYSGNALLFYRYMSVS